MSADIVSQDQSPEQQQRALWHLIEDIRFAMLTTRSESGHLHSRPMTTQKREKDDEELRLWFFMPLSSDAAKEIEDAPQVNVAYASPEEDRYVAVSGTARFVDDLARKQALWSQMTQAWFPKGVDDPDLGLLEVRIEHADYWDVKNNKLTQLVKMAKAAATGTTPDLKTDRGHVEGR